MLVLCQIIEVWKLEIEGDDPATVYNMQTAEIREKGSLTDIIVDHAMDADSI